MPTGKWSAVKPGVPRGIIFYQESIDKKEKAHG
jgi:hypothetical protein